MGHNGRLTSTACPRRTPMTCLRRVLAGVLVAGALVWCTPAAPAAAFPETSGPSSEATDDLYLVTLAGPGVAGHTGPAPVEAFRAHELAEQAAVLSAVAAGPPVY